VSFNAFLHFPFYFIQKPVREAPSWCIPSRNNIILMFVSVCDSLSTQIELPIPLRLTSAPKANISPANYNLTKVIIFNLLILLSKTNKET